MGTVREWHPDRSSDWWAVEWWSEERKEWSLTFSPPHPGWPQLFRTRRECRAFIEEVYGYIRRRPDLRGYPFYWRMPRAVKVDIVKQNG